MAVNYFVGRSQDELEGFLRAAQDDLAAGKTVQDASSGDVSKRENISKSIESRIRMILQALTNLDPGKYPPSQSFATQEYRVTFSGAPSIITQGNG